jgi:hypothetical protein
MVMIIVALDHVRDFFHTGAFRPEDLARTNAALFFTRWITHLMTLGPAIVLPGWLYRLKLPARQCDRSDRPCSALLS